MIQSCIASATLSSVEASPKVAWAATAWPLLTAHLKLALRSRLVPISLLRAACKPWHSRSALRTRASSSSP